MNNLKSICIILSIFIYSTIYAQTQVGGDIDGIATEHELGNAVAISNNGNRVIVGAPVPTNTTTLPGYAKVFDYDGSNWIQVGSDLIGEAAQDRFGSAVAISADGNRIAIGAPLNDESALVAGHTRIFDFDGTDWIQIGDDIDGPASFSQSGFAIDLSADGRKVLIASPEYNQQQGMLQVYELNESNWIQVGNDILGSSTSSLLGRSVSMSADGTIICAGEQTKAIIYQWDGNDWQQLGATLDDATPYIGGQFVVDISSTGNNIIVGFENGSNAAGETRVYRFNGSNWEQIGEVIVDNMQSNLGGFSVSISDDGDRIAIGDPFTNYYGDSPGFVSVFDFNGTSWEEMETEILGEYNDERHGWSLALTPNGNSLIVGSPSNSENGEDAGSARVYRFETDSMITSIQNNLNNSFTDFEIKPNPSNGQFSVSFNNVNQAAGNIQLFSSDGKMIHDYSFEQHNQKIQWDNDFLLIPSSIYFVVLNIGNQTFTNKIFTVSN